MRVKDKKKDVEKVVEFLQKREKVCALLAPTVERTWGNSITKEQFDKVLSDAGFFAWYLIAEEAEQLVLQEVEEWRSRTEDKKSIISSSCPAIVRLIEKEYPDLSAYLSSTRSPMHLASFKAKEEKSHEWRKHRYAGETGILCARKNETVMCKRYASIFIRSRHRGM